MMHRAYRRSGFTLVELLVALAVLLVGVLGLSAVASVVASHIRVARLETRVQALAQAELEGALAEGSDRIASGSGRSGELQFTIEVSGADPRLLSLVVAGHAGSDTVTDTLMTLLRR
jgi:prepilin-type N-terminal cleavage/methylation domain-containing protein